MRDVRSGSISGLVDAGLGLTSSTVLVVGRAFSTSMGSVEYTLAEPVWVFVVPTEGERDCALV